MLTAKQALERSKRARDLRKEKYFPILESIIEQEIARACENGDQCVVVDFNKAGFERGDCNILPFYNNFGVALADKLEENGYTIDFRSDSMLISWGNAHAKDTT